MRGTRPWPVLAACLLALIALTARGAGVRADDTRLFLTHFCTQYGPFALRIEDRLVAGVFAIRTNGDLGSFAGTLEGQTMTGEWIEPDSRGAIVLEFTEDRSRFVARYNVDSNPEHWYEDWIGILRPGDEVDSLDEAGTTFLCE